MKDLYAKILAMLICLQIILITFFPLGAASLRGNCTDLEGKVVSHGMMYVPGPSICSQCFCYHSEPKWCQAIFCSPPLSCKRFRIGRRCCEFECLDNVGTEHWSESDVTIVDGSSRHQKHILLWMLSLVMVIVIF